MAGAVPTSDATWGACRFCGVAVAPGAARCGICGAADPIAAADLPRAPPRDRRRVKALGLLRSLVVVAVALGLAYTLLSTLVAGPPAVADPLTTTGSYTIGPGNYTFLAGEITGGDFVIGNFTTTDPVGVDLAVSVYNSTAWSGFLNGTAPPPEWTLAPSASGQIVFSAPVTDTFYFVFSNPYPVTSHLVETAYVVTTYESNVGDDGFA